jgi:hypothetical protein
MDETSILVRDHFDSTAGSPGAAHIGATTVAAQQRAIRTSAAERFGLWKKGVDTEQYPNRVVQVDMRETGLVG